MLATAAIVAGLALVGQCASDTPGPNCPRPGVVHDCVATIGGKLLHFSGWHDTGGTRHYLPGSNLQFDAAMVRAGLAVGSSIGTSNVALSTGPSPGAAGNYGVNLANVQPGEAGQIRTNDPIVGTALNSALDHSHSADRPCPGPGPCPNPIPESLPDSAIPVRTYVMVGLGIVLALIAGIVFIGALVAGFTFRRGHA